MDWNFPSRLQYLPVKVIVRSECQKHYPLRNITNDVICAQGSANRSAGNVNKNDNRLPHVLAYKPTRVQADSPPPLPAVNYKMSKMLDPRISRP